MSKKKKVAAAKKLTKAQKLMKAGNAIVANTIETIDVVSPTTEVFQSSRRFSFSLKTSSKSKAATIVPLDEQGNELDELQRNKTVLAEFFSELSASALVSFLALQLMRATQREAFQAHVVLQHSDELNAFFDKNPKASWTLDTMLLKSKDSDKAEAHIITLNAESWILIRDIVAPACLARYELTHKSVATRSRTKRTRAQRVSIGFKS